MLFWVAGCALKGESEANNEVEQREENEGKKDFSNEEKERTKGLAELLAFAGCHNMREPGCLAAGYIRMEAKGCKRKKMLEECFFCGRLRHGKS